MEKGIRKPLLFFVLFVPLLVLVILLGREIARIGEITKGNYSGDIIENVKGENMSPSETPKEEVIVVTGVNVPYYWKYGLNTEQKEYIYGYIPSLKEYQAYIKNRDMVLYGVESGITDRISVLDLNEDIYSKTIYVKGIVSDSEYLKWGDECSVVRLDKTYFVCPNWINLFEKDISKKLFVSVKCKVGDIDGLCIFEDYTGKYFNIKRSIETRCVGDIKENMYCDLNKYLKIVEYN